MANLTPEDRIYEMLSGQSVALNPVNGLKWEGYETEAARHTRLVTIETRTYLDPSNRGNYGASIYLTTGATFINSIREQGVLLCTYNLNSEIANSNYYDIEQIDDIRNHIESAQSDANNVLAIIKYGYNDASYSSQNLEFLNVINQCLKLNLSNAENNREFHLIWKSGQIPNISYFNNGAPYLHSRRMTFNVSYFSNINRMYPADMSLLPAYHNMYKLEMPMNPDKRWEWRYLLMNIKTCYENEGFTDPCNFVISVRTDGSEMEVSNPESWQTLLTDPNIKNDNIKYHFGNIEYVGNRVLNLRDYTSRTGMTFTGDINLTVKGNETDARQMLAGNNFITTVNVELQNTSDALEMFRNCGSLTSATLKSDSVVNINGIFNGCTTLNFVDISGLTKALDASNAFRNTAGSTFLQNGVLDEKFKIPSTLTTANNMFDNAGLTRIKGNWVAPNPSTAYQNWVLNENKEMVKDWEFETSTQGFEFPKNLSITSSMFANNPNLQEVKDLQTYPTMRCSQMFQNCGDVKFDNVWININSYDNSVSKDYYYNMFSNVTVAEDSKIWLPIDISSNFNLADTAVTNSLINFYVNDGWATVDDKTDPQPMQHWTHLRRRKYYNALKDALTSANKENLFITWFSNIDVKSMHLQGYNEMFDTDVYYGNNPKYAVDKKYVYPDWYGIDEERTRNAEKKYHEGMI